MHGNEQIKLSNGYFHIVFNRGFLASIHPGASVTGERDTDYICPGAAFGGVTMTAGGQSYDCLWEKEDCAWQTEKVDRRGILCQKTEETLPFTLEEAWEMAGESLLLTLRVVNRGEGPLHISDLGLRFPANSDFSWECHAGAKVIGHHWIAEHNSHLLFQRCDGAGPALMVLPTGDTSLEYYEGDEKVKGSLTAYCHSEGVRREALAQGAVIHTASTAAEIAPGASRSYRFRFLWARDTEHARIQKANHGLMDIQVLPGMTVPRHTPVRVAIRGAWEGMTITPPDRCEVTLDTSRQNVLLAALDFGKTGENTVTLSAADGRHTSLVFFVTEPMETLIAKRGRFIAAHQHRDASKWYDGLLAEWNNETGVMLGPDQYDRISGWRIYEVSCDDPGLSKPAFLSSKLAESPVEEEAAALDRYVEKFVWGGLQCTTEEAYPYAIYGIPDWKTLRDSEDPDLRGRLHIWRIYDYPHIALMYYNLYRMARQYPHLPLTQTARTYLDRAAQTAIAMFLVPLELDGWSAFGTGLYNELVIEDILSALEREGMAEEKRRLERLWNRKAYQFAQKNADVFGSEYPFDTTGFESTHILAKRALNLAKSGRRMEDREISPDRAADFMENQMRCNIACRGEMEMVYWLYGSDYRGDNLHYTLSYMSQMGGWAILDYALYHAADPFPFLRLGYGSILSSWALLNSGSPEDGYGWRFPGKAHDGAASGGFEPCYLGKTWLEQPHHGGAWYYSCEIDLGFCGYMRAASTILAEDPLFGLVCLGGRMRTEGGALVIQPEDGVGRRVHVVTDRVRLHVTASCGNLRTVAVDPAGKTVEVALDMTGIACEAEVSFQWTENPAADEPSRGRSIHTMRTTGKHTFSWQINTEKELGLCTVN